MKRTSVLIVATCFSVNAEEIDPAQLFNLPLEALLDVKISLASGIQEKLVDSPSSIEIISAEQISHRGYSDLSEVLADLTGIDSAIVNGSIYSLTTARGHVALAGVRVMLNGVEDNNLWDNNPYISRQYPLGNVERVEVLYGPSSVLYGANAYLLTINLITKDARQLKRNQHHFRSTLSAASFDTQYLDLGTSGRLDEFSYEISARYFTSDEPDYSDRWGFLSNENYNNRSYWGPLLDPETTGRNLGHYADPSRNWGIMGRMNYHDLTLGFISWKTAEAYGPQYSGDKTQNNVIWNNASDQLYLGYQWRLNEKVKAYSQVLHRESRLWGDWAESLPFDDETSFISYTRWNSDNASTQFRQNFEYEINPNLSINGEFEFKRNRLSRNYDIPGYFGLAFSSGVPATDPGPHGFGAAIGLSTDESYQLVAPPRRRMPDENIQHIYDRGGYLQAIFEQDKFRYHLGIRYDNNSVYGSVVTPRASLLYRYNSQHTFKLSYGEGYLAPSALLRYGGFSGRNADPDLEPEESFSLEASWLYQTQQQLHTINLFRAEYDNMIGLGVSADSHATGLEYRGKFEFGNLLSSALPDSELYVNASYIDTQANHIFDSQSQIWREQDVTLGGFAPFKINMGLNFPVYNGININLRARYTSALDHHIGNILREQNNKHPSVTLFDLIASYSKDNLTVTLKLTNLFDKEYNRSGILANSGGNDFSQRSAGFANSEFPQEKAAMELMIGWLFLACRLI